MSIAIDEGLCVGCGACVTACPGSLLVQDGDAPVRSPWPEDCWACASCVKVCSRGALKLYLGADLGGRGGRLWVRQEQQILDWIFELPDGSTRVISVDSSDANRY
ncbi:MAG: 4Fe-4S binding protein [Coriobacteriales bacterium]|jgi:adenylylsulfate reductase subunit B|nr:4Fe-4S binding protein [Coriobacteriales bacterium]